MSGQRRVASDVDSRWSAVAAEAHPRLVKLVRDGIGKHSPDGTVTYGPVRKSFHVDGLRRKLMEEATEYLLNPCEAELADVLEVVRALAIVDLGVNFHDIEKLALDKYGDRGGFTEGVGMWVNSTAVSHG